MKHHMESEETKMPQLLVSTKAPELPGKLSHQTNAATIVGLGSQATDYLLSVSSRGREIKHTSSLMSLLT